MARKKILWLFPLLFLFPLQPSAMTVQTNQTYTYKVLVEDLFLLRWKYSNEIKVHPIGSSHAGRKIWAVKLGNGKKNIVIIGSHHGREWITSLLVMKMLEKYAEAYTNNSCLGLFSTEQFDDVSIWFVPMLNPDGVTIQQNHLHFFPKYQRNWLIEMNDRETNFAKWKANGLGVDLNRQYPSGWKEIGETLPSYGFYKGKNPLEAEEVKAVTDFVGKTKPLAAIAYHSAGREIFWQYHNGKNYERDRILATKLAEMTGYKLGVPPHKSMGGGFTDWFITTYRKPSFTIEISPLVGERNPPLSVFNEEWKRNEFVGIRLAYEVEELFMKKHTMNKRGYTIKNKCQR